MTLELVWGFIKAVGECADGKTGIDRRCTDLRATQRPTNAIMCSGYRWPAAAP